MKLAAAVMSSCADFAMALVRLSPFRYIRGSTPELCGQYFVKRLGIYPRPNFIHISTHIDADGGAPPVQEPAGSQRQYQTQAFCDFVQAGRWNLADALHEKILAQRYKL